MAKLIITTHEGVALSAKIIQGEPFTFGRGPANTYILEDPKSSWRHGQIKYKKGRYILEDLKSTNGISVGRTQINETHNLEHEDQIRIGDTILEFQYEEKDKRPSAASLLDSDPGTDPEEFILGTLGGGTASVSMREIEMESFARPTDGGQANVSDSLVKKLMLLQRLGMAMNQVENTERLFQEISIAVREAIGPERMFILVRKGMKWEKRFGVDWVGAGPPDSSTVHHIIAEEAITKKETIHVPDVRKIPGVKSKLFQAVMAAPLIRPGRVEGVIYIDHQQQNDPFEETHLRLLGLIANQTALLFDQAGRLKGTDDGMEVSASATETVMETLIREFSRTVHSIRMTCLNARETMLMDPDHANPLQGIESINQQAEQIDDLLDALQIESTRSSLIEQLVVSEILAEAIEGLPMEAKKRDITLSWDAPPDLPKLRGSRSRLVPLFKGLFSAALLRAPKGGTIRLRAQFRGTEIGFEFGYTNPDLPEGTKGGFEINPATFQFEGETPNPDWMNLPVLLAQRLAMLLGGRLGVKLGAKVGGQDLQVVLFSAQTSA